jgi:hypothetical protein
MKILDAAIITFIKTDITPIRFMIGLSSLLWAAFSLLPGTLFKIKEVCANIFNNPDILNWFIFSEALWASLFFFHSIVIFTSLFTGKYDRFTLFADGVIGSFIWFFSVSLCILSHITIWAEFQPPAVLAAGITITLAQWWNLIMQWAKFPIAQKD